MSQFIEVFEYENEFLMRLMILYSDVSFATFKFKRIIFTSIFITNISILCIFYGK